MASFGSRKHWSAAKDSILNWWWAVQRMFRLYMPNRVCNVSEHWWRLSTNGCSCSSHSCRFYRRLCSEDALTLVQTSREPIPRSECLWKPPIKDTVDMSLPANLEMLAKSVSAVNRVLGRSTSLETCWSPENIRFVSVFVFSCIFDFCCFILFYFTFSFFVE